MIYRMFGKRFFDIALSVLAFIILLPVLFIISILIKIFDPGPIIFKQTRVGKNNKHFFFYKFRSMPVNTGDLPSDKVGKVKLTWIGKFIRRTNIDELPQLFNILKGDMSIVGPRPPITSQQELLTLRTANHSITLTPGLTGLAQVNSFDGMSISDKATFDAEYLSKYSFIFDLKIILNTFLYLFRPPPVY